MAMTAIDLCAICTDAVVKQEFEATLH